MSNECRYMGMDRSVNTPNVENEIQFLLSLLRISNPGQPAPQASDVIEGILATAHSHVH
jgi:hypothetical protein